MLLKAWYVLHGRKTELLMIRRKFCNIKDQTAVQCIVRKIWHFKLMLAKKDKLLLFIEWHLCYRIDKCRFLEPTGSLAWHGRVMTFFLPALLAEDLCWFFRSLENRYWLQLREWAMSSGHRFLFLCFHWLNTLSMIPFKAYLNKSWWCLLCRLNIYSVRS